MRVLLVVVAASVLAIAAWLWWPEADATLPESGRLPEAVAPAPPVDPAVAPTTPSAAPVPAELPQPAMPRVAASNEHPEVPPLPADANWIEVTIVDASSGAPVPGAAVRWSNEVQDALRRHLSPAEQLLLFEQPELAAARFAWRATSDPDGKVRVAGAPRMVLVEAQKDERFGAGEISIGRIPPAIGHRVELHVDQTLRVLTCDASGNPVAGVLVGAVPLTNALVDGTPRGLLVSGSTRRSDAAGIATFPHCQQLVRQWGNPEVEARHQLALAHRQPGMSDTIASNRTDAESPIVDAFAPPDEPVPLRLPPTATMHVTLLRDGAPFVPGSLFLAEQDPNPRNGQLHLRWSFLPEPDGSFELHHLPLGRTWRLAPGFDGIHNGWNDGYRVVGPTAPGQRQAVEIELGTDVVSLRGRAVDVDGQPFAGQWLRVRYELGFGKLGLQAQCDADGRFDFAAGKAGDAPLKWQQVEFELARSGQPLLRAVPDARVLQRGINDLGDVQLLEPPLLVRGRFTFDDGASHRVMLRVFCRPTSTDSGSPGEWRGVDGVDIVQMPGDDTFEVRGTFDPGEFQLTLQCQDAMPHPPVAFVPGTTDLTIALHIGHELEATCLFPQGLDAQQILLRLMPGDGNTSEPLVGRPHALMAERATYRWPPLEAGRFTLRVQSFASPTPLLELPDVIVPPPPDGDARLAAIDLREHLQVLQLTCDLPADSPTREQPMVFVLPQPDDEHWRGSRLRGPNHKLLLPPGPVDLMVCATGLRPTTLRAVQQQATVTLQKWPTASLRLTGFGELPEGVHLQVSARGASAHQPERRTFLTEGHGGNMTLLLHPLLGSTSVDADGRASVTCDDGPCSLNVRVAVGKDSKLLLQITPREVHAGGDYDVQLSADEVAAAIAALHGK
ncbi:MAG: hypothetical protein R3F29_08610 [Planctomycetota bacterium]